MGGTVCVGPLVEVSVTAQREEMRADAVRALSYMTDRTFPLGETLFLPSLLPCPVM